MSRLGPLLQLTRAPLRAPVIAVVIAAGFVGALAWYLGTDAVHAIVIAVGVLVISVAWLAVPQILPPEWPDDSRAEDDGGRGDVRQLSWSLRPRRGRVRQRAITRIRVLAADRLAAHGLDLNEPDDRARIEALIGRRPFHTLLPNPVRQPYLRDVEHCLDALSRLVVNNAGVTEPTASPPTTLSRILIRRRPS